MGKKTKRFITQTLTFLLCAYTLGFIHTTGDYKDTEGIIKIRNDLINNYRQDIKENKDNLKYVLSLYKNIEELKKDRDKEGEHLEYLEKSVFYFPNRVYSKLSESINSMGPRIEKEIENINIP